MDYGKRAPDLGWRMTDAWLSMAGSTSPGLPNGRPDRRVGHPHGRRAPAIRPARRCRAAAAPTAPASVYAIAKWDEWLRKYAPPGAADLDFYQSLPALQPGQRGPADLLVHGLHRRRWWRRRARATTPSTTRASPLWRMAPSPHGPYWKEGMKLGYQDAGSWTLFKSTPVDRRKAAWLYAQFVVVKTVDVKKSHVGLTVIRDSTIRHKSFTERAPSSAAWSSSIARPTASPGRRPASTFPTIRSWPSSGGSRSVT